MDYIETILRWVFLMKKKRFIVKHTPGRHAGLPRGRQGEGEESITDDQSGMIPDVEHRDRNTYLQTVDVEGRGFHLFNSFLDFHFYIVYLCFYSVQYFPQRDVLHHSPHPEGYTGSRNTPRLHGVYHPDHTPWGP